MSKSIATKISAICGEIGGLEKDGKNKDSNYGFISYEHLNAVLRPLLMKHKLAMIPSFEECVESEVISKSGGKGVRTIVKGKMTLMCGETGDVFTTAIMGADQDYGGKSMSQAETEAHKRFILKTFFVSSHDDVDPDGKTTPAENGFEASVITPQSTKAPKTISELKEDRINEVMKKSKCSREEAMKKIDDYLIKKSGKGLDEIETEEELNV